LKPGILSTVAAQIRMARRTRREGHCKRLDGGRLQDSGRQARRVLRGESGPLAPLALALARTVKRGLRHFATLFATLRQKFTTAMSAGQKAHFIQCLQWFLRCLRNPTKPVEIAQTRILSPVRLPFRHSGNCCK
jgi:hypothetical protein